MIAGPRQVQWTKRLAFVLAGAIGAVFALIAVDHSFIVGTGGRWAHPDNDLVAYLVAWNYFIADQWRLPLFSLPQMGYPEGGSLLFNDGLPIVSLLSKIVFHIAGLRINPFGWWILFTYVMQGMMGARIVRALGATSLWAAMGAAVLVVCSVPFTSRLGHIALSGHFVVLWALALYFESVRDRRLRLGEMAVCAAFVLLVNPYLFAMVMAIQATTVITIAVDTRPGFRFWLGLVLAYGAVVLVGVTAGYGAVLINPTGMRAAGFGLYSFNPPTLLIPPEAFWGVPHGWIRDATGGQYEGESYIGAGALLLLVLYLAGRRHELRAAVRRHRILCAMFLLLAIFAASNKVYIGQTLVVSYYLPPFLERLASFFRVSGRFVWPLAYSLMLVPLAVAHRRWRPVAAILLTLVAIVLQAAEMVKPVLNLRAYSSKVSVDLVDTSRTGGWMLAHSRVWQYPSWECGGLVRTGRAYGSRDVNQELQLQLLAARLGKPTNSVLMSRAQKNCAVEAQWAEQALLEPDVFYLLGREAAHDSPVLARLAASAACKPMEWGFACSALWAAPTAPISISPASKQPPALP